jgi:molybdopterin-biosynthesis enzyme MoeA-like protein
MKDVEMIAIGNEILLGTVLDTNSNWLCKTSFRKGRTGCA